MLAGLRRGRGSSRSTVDTSTRAGLEAAARATIAAMRDGRGADPPGDVPPRRLGRPRRLRRTRRRPPSDARRLVVPRPSTPSSPQRVKPAALLQLAEYSEHLTRIQGVAPEHVVVITGDGARHALPLADVRERPPARSRREFRAAVLAGGTRAPATYPDPVSRCRICRWVTVCDERRRADDHLGFVAGIRPDQIAKLAEAGITHPPGARRRAGPSRPAQKIAPPVYERLRRQAALQVRGEGAAPPVYELLDPGCRRGRPVRVRALPVAVAGDLFLDLEGDSLGARGRPRVPVRLRRGDRRRAGVPTVLGPHRERGALRVRGRGRPHLERRRAPTPTCTCTTTRATRRPRSPGSRSCTAPARPSRRPRRATACSSTCTRSEAVAAALDRVLRAEVGRAALPAASVAARCSMPARASSCTRAYLADPDPHRLDEIAAYNRDDCESLVLLQAWLEARRSDSVQPCSEPTP